LKKIEETNGAFRQHFHQEPQFINREPYLTGHFKISISLKLFKLGTKMILLTELNL